MFISLYFAPAYSYGGPVVTLERLVDELASGGDDCCVVTSNADGLQTLNAETVRRPSGAVVHYCPRLFGGLFAPWALVRSIAESRERSAIYVWGIFVWLLPVLLVVGHLRRIPLVVASGGMLFEGAISRHRLRKVCFLGLLRALKIEQRAVFHVTAASEISAIRRYFPSCRFSNVPHGVDACDTPAKPEAMPYLLFLGRIDRIKRIELIIRAYSAAATGGRDSRLVIAGDGAATYLAELQSVAREVDTVSRVVFRGYVEGREKSELLASATAVVLCSRSENFGIVVAEALAAGTPVIVTTTTPWSMVEAKGVGWYVHDSVPAIAEAMRAALNLSYDERCDISRRAKEWMREDYSWSSVAVRMQEVFETVVARSEAGLPLFD